MIIIILPCMALVASCGKNAMEEAATGSHFTGVVAASPDLRPDYPQAEWVGEACGYWPAARSGKGIDLIVIHTCQMEFYECWAYLQGCHWPSSSAHYVVQSSDGNIVQMVRDGDVAWHATCLNRASIGIEHEGWMEHPEQWFTDAMYCSSAHLSAWLAEEHAIPKDRDHIIGHDEANALYCGGNHNDPGPGWDWDFYMQLVKVGCDPCAPGESRCSENELYVEVCDSSGMSWSTTERCKKVCREGRCPLEIINEK